VTTARGEWFTAVDAHQLPGCVQQPRLPFTVAAAGPRAMRLAARYGQSWVTYGPYGAAVEPDAWLAAVAEQSARLSGVLAEVGREAGDLRRIALVGVEETWPFEGRDRYEELLGRLADAGIDEVALHWPRPDGRGVPAAALPEVLAAHGL
jgi:alkanesulfonate monooxygenase SsuD/methylene tetrahydromethanopterin reductase-like flavin-dependent oxidoreductase (luciferase family)